MAGENVWLEKRMLSALSRVFPGLFFFRFQMNIVSPETMEACKYVTLVSAAIIVAIFVIFGLLSLLNGSLGGIFLIIIPLAIGALIYLNIDETCRNKLTWRPQMNMGRGISINF